MNNLQVLQLEYLFFLIRAQKNSGDSKIVETKFNIPLERILSAQVVK